MPIHRSRLPVLSVGGLEAGGSGKTPVVGWLLQALLALGHQPGLLSRGYGRRGTQRVVRSRGEPVDAAVLGDEPAMLVRSGLDIPVAVCAVRRLGAAALAAHGCDVLVLDDGFAHRSLARQLDIVVLRGETPFGTGHMLPWGTLREPPSSLRRAHVVWLHYKSAQAIQPMPSWWMQYCPHATLVHSRLVVSTPYDARCKPVALAGARVCAAAGIAWPRQFLQTLHGQGADVVSFAGYRDHYDYERADVAALRAQLQQTAAQALVVTAKDAVKLAPLWPDPATLWVVGATVQIEYGESAFLEAVKDALNQYANS